MQNRLLGFESAYRSGALRSLEDILGLKAELLSLLNVRGGGEFNSVNFLAVGLGSVALISSHDGQSLAAIVGNLAGGKPSVDFLQAALHDTLQVYIRLPRYQPHSDRIEEVSLLSNPILDTIKSGSLAFACFNFPQFNSREPRKTAVELTELMRFYARFVRQFGSTGLWDLSCILIGGVENGFGPGGYAGGMGLQCLKIKHFPEGELDGGLIERLAETHHLGKVKKWEDFREIFQPDEIIRLKGKSKILSLRESRLLIRKSSFKDAQGIDCESLPLHWDLLTTGPGARNGSLQLVSLNDAESRAHIMLNSRGLPQDGNLNLEKLRDALDEDFLPTLRKIRHTVEDMRH